MNSAKSLFNQQLGLSRWTRFDCVLQRFICDKNSEYECIFDYNDHVTEETPIFACKFSQSEGYLNLLALANECGSVVIVDTEKRKFTRHGGTAHHNAIFDIAWVPNSRKLLTASGDHSASLIDLSSSFRTEATFISHTRSLKTIATCEQNASIFATGARDGRINVWDIRVGSQYYTATSPSFSIPYSHLQSSQVKDCNRFRRVTVSAANSVTGLVFQDHNTFLSCGAGDGFIKVWDMRKTYYARNRAPAPKYVFPYSGKTFKNGFSHLVIDYHRNILYANCLDNVIYAYNINTYNPVPIMKYYGHKNRTFYVKMCLGIGGEYILSGSSDHHAYIWHRSRPTPLVRLVGHDAEVTGVGWNAYQNDLLVTCSDDFKQKYWAVCNRELTMEEKIREYVGYAETAPTVVIDIDSSNRTDILADMNITNSCCCAEFKTECSCNRDGGRIIKDTTPERNPLQAIDQNLFRTNNVTESDSKKRRLEGDTNLPSTSKMCDIDCDTDSSAYYGSDTDTSASVSKKPRTEVIGTLLTDLPNFQVDGKAPHLIVSPLKHREKDWLTKLRLQIATTSELRELSNTSPNTEKSSPKPVVNKRNEAPVNSPILKYFKHTYSPTSSRAKSPSITIPSTPPSSSE